MEVALIIILTQMIDTMSELKFLDLETQQKLIRENIEKRIKTVLEHNYYIMGPEVAELENELAKFCGAKHVISCANGTDAIEMVLMAKDVQPNHAIFVPSFTFAATAEVVRLAGAQPVFIDVLPDTFNIDPESLVKGIKTAKEHGLIPAGVIAVDIFGQPANYDKLEQIAGEHGIWLLCDSAQSFGGVYKGKKVGTIGIATTTSFFPAKPLGCYGDGGCVFTNDDQLADLLRSIKSHGQGHHRYENVRVGMNSRLDTIQAAILLEKLKIFPEELKKRQAVADLYDARLRDFVITPHIIPETKSAWAVYTVLLKDGNKRDTIQEALKAAGIPTMIYYPKPLHLQKAYSDCLKADTSLSISELLSSKVLSLPIHPYLDFSQGHLDKLVEVLSSTK